MRCLVSILFTAVLFAGAPAAADDDPLDCDDLKGMPSLYKLCKADEEGGSASLCYRDWRPITQADELEDDPGVFTTIATCRSGGEATGGGFNLGDARTILASQPAISAGRVVGWECTVAGRNRKNPQCFVVCCR